MKVLNGEELLSQLLVQIEADSEVRSQEGADVSSRFDELMRTLVPTDDPRATFFELLAAADQGELSELTRPDPEQAEALAILGVRYAQWFETDPMGAMAALKESSSQAFAYVNGKFIHRISSDLYQRQGLRVAMKWLPKLLSRTVALQHIAKDVGGRGSREDLRWLLAEHPEMTSGTFAAMAFSGLGGSWPLDDRDALVEVITGAGRIRAMIAIAGRMDGTEGIDWIRSWIEGGLLSGEELGALSNNPAALQLARQVGDSLEAQIGVLQQLSVLPAEVSHPQRAQMISRHIDTFLNSPESQEDWLYGFRHGQVSADEVLAAALAACPDPGTQINEFRSQIFRHLAEDDLDAAMHLFDGMSDRDREWQKVYAARWWFNGVEPDRYYELTSSIPYQDEPAMRTYLRDGWRDRSGSNLERYGESYLEWVRDLPEGQDRTWALEGLRDASLGRYAHIHDQVIALLEGSR